MFYRITSNPYGFSSNFINALSQLWAFDNIERERTDGKSDIAIVDWTDPNWLYAESEPVYGTTNVWEYYCHQPQGFGVDKIKGAVMDGIPEYDLRHDQAAEKQPCLPDIRRLIKKYIKPQNHVELHVEQLSNPFSHRTVLGVHYRDTDMGPIHGRHVPIETTFERIMSLRPKFDMIFLATECQVALGKFKAWAKSQSIKLEHTSCFRVAPGAVEDFMAREESQYQPESYMKTKARLLHIHEFELGKNQRPLHKYQLGLEVFTDILLLSKCQYFLHGYSGVSNLATFFSEAPVENIFTYS